MKRYLVILVLLVVSAALSGVLLSGAESRSEPGDALSLDAPKTRDMSDWLSLDVRTDEGKIEILVWRHERVDYQWTATFLPGPSKYKHTRAATLLVPSVVKTTGDLWQWQKLLVPKDALGKQCHVRVDLFAHPYGAPRDSAYTLVASKLLDIRGKKGQMPPKEDGKPEGSESP